VDFVAVRNALEAVTKEFDYKYINDHPAFAGRNTSAENLARHFAESIQAFDVLGDARVAEVTVWEGPDNRATYRQA
jgi:6-pyruvoyltetrahydropterin/6-carboxytetrahydropterin synthase